MFIRYTLYKKCQKVIVGWGEICIFALTTMTKRGIILNCVVAVALGATAQEVVTVPVTPPATNVETPNLQPTKPEWTTPPTVNTPEMPEAPSLDLTPRSLTDSLAAYNDNSSLDVGSTPRYDFVMNPYGRNWARSGAMAMPGGGWLVGNGGFNAMPGLGNIGSASLRWVQPLGENFTVSAGMVGTKYHFDRDAWNDYGFTADASYSLNEHFALKAWGSYYMNQSFHSMGAMPYMGTSEFGGALDWRMNQYVGMQLGARRTYDPFTRRWYTMPVIAPTVYVLGSPISIDLGGLFKSWLDKRVFNDRTYDPIDPINSGKRMNMSNPVDRNGLPTPQRRVEPPGFNPNSPVRIPDALRR